MRPMTLQSIKPWRSDYSTKSRIVYRTSDGVALAVDRLRSDGAYSERLCYFRKNDGARSNASYARPVNGHRTKWYVFYSIRYLVRRWRNEISARVQLIIARWSNAAIFVVIALSCVMYIQYVYIYTYILCVRVHI